jgi:hypothetical protein
MVSDNKDYFWLNDMTPVMIAHPYVRFGRVRILRITPIRGGSTCFSILSKFVKEREGFVEYMWQ